MSQATDRTHRFRRCGSTFDALIEPPSPIKALPVAEQVQQWPVVEALVEVVGPIAGVAQAVAPNQAAVGVGVLFQEWIDGVLHRLD